MNKISKRQSTILQQIEKHHTITGNRLSDNLNVSLRTIQYEIKELNKQFNIIESSRNGYSLKENYYNLDFSIENNNEDIYSLLIQLTVSNNKTNIDDLLDEYYLSMSSLNKKLNQIKDILNKYQLYLRKAKGYIWIEGFEENKRKLISSIINLETEHEINNSIISYKKYLNDIDIDYIKSLTLNTINNFGYQINPNYGNNLLVNIYIALYRSRTYTSNLNIIKNENIKNSIEYDISKDICNHYSSTWQFEINENDIYYLASILQGQLISLETKKRVRHKANDNDEFYKEIELIVKDTFNYYKIDLPTKNFIYNFSLHVSGLIKRSQHMNNAQSNDLLENVQRNCPFIYDVSVTIAKKICNKYNITISDDEIGFIAIHIGVQIESNANYRNIVNILLLTSKYQNITKNIKTKLTEKYQSKIKIFERLEDIESSNIDLIFSNKSQNILGKKLITISPFFNEDDQSKVSNAINQCIRKKEKDFQGIIINTFFKEDLFFKTKRSFTKNEAIEFLCNELLKKRVVDVNFLNSVYERENSSSTCFFNLFAIPHAFEFLGKKTRFAILISEEGIEWDDSKIHLVLLMSIKLSDRRIFMSIYNTIIQALQSKTIVDKLIESNNLTEFIGIIQDD